MEFQKTESEAEFLESERTANKPHKSTQNIIPIVKTRIQNRERINTNQHSEQEQLYFGHAIIWTIIISHGY